jgi:hypothetical protein
LGEKTIAFFPTNQTFFVAVDEVAQDSIMDEFRSARRVNDIQILVTALGVCFNLLMCRFAVFFRDNWEWIIVFVVEVWYMAYVQVWMNGAHFWFPEFLFLGSHRSV